MQYLPPDPNDLATKSDLRELRSGLDHRMDGLDHRMDGLEMRMDRMERLMERFDDRLYDFHGALREQTRVFVASSVGTMITLSIVVFGAARLM